MDIVQLARELGKAVQQDEAYIKMRICEEAKENDEELSELIMDYNIKRMSLNQEIAKEEKDQDKISAFNKELRGIYSKIMQNKNMAEFEKARRAFDEKIQEVYGIINNCIDGQDPDTTQYDASIGCGGNCSSCAGCG